MPNNLLCLFTITWYFKYLHFQSGKHGL